MNENQLGGWSLIASVACAAVTVVLHPTGHELMGDGRLAAEQVNVIAHSLAIVGMPLSANGFLALTRTLSSPDRLSTAAFIVHVQALVAVTIAAVASGLLATELFRELAGADDELTRALLAYTHDLNQAFATLYAVASSAAIGLWSLSALRAARFCRYFGAVGSGIGVLGVLATVSGHLRLDVHGLGALVCSQGLWTIWAARLLLKLPTDSANSLRGPDGQAAGG
jgi:hypothetical protein